jgi:drug/metabolite transporter (DMT)-like permease
VCATMPLWVAVFAVFGKDKPSVREWVSLAMGFAGVVILMGGPALAGDPVDVALLVCSPIAWALGSTLSRKQPKTEHPVMATAMQMLIGGVALAIGGLGRGEPLPLHASTTAWLAVAYLVVFGSIIGFTAYDWLLRNARPVVATSYAYVNPIIAVLIGAALHGEVLGWSTLVANILIVSAVMLALRRR